MKQSGRKLTLSILLLPTLLIGYVLVARAANLVVSEAPLNPDGRVFEVNLDDQGNLWLADLDANEVWQVDRASGVYTIFQGIPAPSDARRAPDGSVWWGELGEGRLGRLQPATGELTWWEAPGATNIFGIHFDGLGRVWATAEVEPKLYRFDPLTNEMCTYTLPQDGKSYYLLAAEDALWLGDRVNSRLYRVRPSTGQFTYWELPPDSEPHADSEPHGLALGRDGELWYADPNLSRLGRLRPEQDELTIFEPPRGSLIEMLSVVGDEIWYTDLIDGTVGNLDPAAAGGVTSTVSRGSTESTPTCVTQAPAATGSVTMVSGMLQWTDATYEPLVEEDGWEVYELPTDARPEGIASDGARIWFVDLGRQVLGRIDYAAAVEVCLLADEDGSNNTTGDRTPLSGWTVYLTVDGARQEPGISTDSVGCASWEGLAPGEVYGVEQVVPQEWVAMEGASHSFGLATRGTVYAHTFLNTPMDTMEDVYLPLLQR